MRPDYFPNPGNSTLLFADGVNLELDPVRSVPICKERSID